MACYITFLYIIFKEHFKFGYFAFSIFQIPIYPVRYSSKKVACEFKGASSTFRITNPFQQISILIYIYPRCSIQIMGQNLSCICILFKFTSMLNCIRNYLSVNRAENLAPIYLMSDIQFLLQHIDFYKFQ